MIGLLIHLIILLVIVGLIYWAITILPIPEPFKKIAIVLLIVVVVLVLIGELLPLAGGPSWLDMRR